MGSLQRKEMEVSCKMKKKEMHTLQKHSCQGFRPPEGGNRSSTRKRSNHSTLSLSQDKCDHSNGTLQVHTTSKEGNIKLSQAFNPEQLRKLSSSATTLDQNGPLEVCEDSFHAFGAPFDVPISESATKVLDPRCGHAELVHPGNLKISVSKSKTSNPSRDASQSRSGDRYVAYDNNKEQCLLESAREQELALSNLSLNGPFSMADISGKNNLLKLINYFPQKAHNFCSRKKLLILDINGILADIVYPPPKGHKADTKIAGRAVFTRPFCSDFLSFCLERFNVAIWSSRSRICPIAPNQTSEPLRTSIRHWFLKSLGKSGRVMVLIIHGRRVTLTNQIHYCWMILPIRLCSILLTLQSFRILMTSKIELILHLVPGAASEHIWKN